MPRSQAKVPRAAHYPSILRESCIHPSLLFDAAYQVNWTIIKKLAILLNIAYNFITIKNPSLVFDDMLS